MCLDLTIKLREVCILDKVRRRLNYDYCMSLCVNQTKLKVRGMQFTVLLHKNPTRST